jgi:hypothetical protein
MLAGPPRMNERRGPQAVVGEVPVGKPPNGDQGVTFGLADGSKLRVWTSPFPVNIGTEELP